MKINGKNITVTNIQKNNITITSPTGWVLDGDIYSYQYNDVDIIATSLINIIPENSTIDIVIEAQILPEIDIYNGYCKIYSINIPSGNFLITVNIS